MSWTQDRDDQLIALHRDGLTGGQIAERIGGGVSRSAVIARLNRLRVKNVSGVAPARPSPITQSIDRRREEMTRLADAFAAGAATIGDAGRRAGLTSDRAYPLWQAIKAELGRQAR